MSQLSPKEARKMVADALRSGKYKQGKGALCITGQLDFLTGNAEKFEEPHFCCLGVACQVYHEQVEPLRVEETPDRRTFNSATAFMPYTVQKWLGMDPAGTFIEADGSEGNLPSCNDNLNKSFEEIADLFENANFRESQLFAEEINVA